MDTDELNNDYIDWNSDTQYLKDLSKEDYNNRVAEYRYIERKAKDEGNWLKMKDGTTWEGNPMTWVHMQSRHYKPQKFTDVVDRSYLKFDKEINKIRNSIYGNVYAEGGQPIDQGVNLNLQELNKAFNKGRRWINKHLPQQEEIQQNNIDIPQIDFSPYRRMMDRGLIDNVNITQTPENNYEPEVEAHFTDNGQSWESEMWDMFDQISPLIHEGVDGLKQGAKGVVKKAVPYVKNAVEGVINGINMPNDIFTPISEQLDRKVDQNQGVGEVAGNRAIYLDFADHPVNLTANTGSPIVEWASRVSGVKSLPLGHAGVIFVDQDGKTKYYDYGRYSEGYFGEPAVGNYRTREVPDMLQDESLESYINRLSGVFPGEPTIIANMYNNTNIGEAEKAILEDANNPNRAEYSLTGDNPKMCKSVALKAATTGLRNPSPVLQYTFKRE